MVPKVETEVSFSNAASAANESMLTTETVLDTDESSAEGGHSPEISTNDLVALAERKDCPNSRPKQTLKDRSRVPKSAYVTVGVVIALQYFSGMYANMLEVLTSLQRSIVTSSQTVYETVLYLQSLCQAIVQGETRDFREYVYALIFTVLVGCIGYVLLAAPLRAGMWTGNKAKRHKIHRYFGLAFLIQYALAWTEFLTNYENGYSSSYLINTIALNGIIQAMSAYFSFKVLPELEDAGYFSDKAVMSRHFVHENTFFQLLSVFGSVFYNDTLRAQLMSNLGGKLVVYSFVFFPYIVIRPFYPITRFKNAGSGMSGRTEKWQKFYEIGTTMIKIFYLWAKYFLGFFLQWVLWLDVATPENLKFMRGLLLLNVGTVSIAMFLHTLRFKKVLPPQLTFSIYVLQVYATFSAIPYAYDLFASHKALCGLALSGILANMTRNRKMHAVWCVCSMAILHYANVDW